MEVLKENSRSLCPVCLASIPARAVKDNHGVFLEKSCPSHGPTRTLAEPDSDFYAAAMGAARPMVPTEPLSPEIKLIILPTYRCNMNCRVCYIPRRDMSMDLSLEEIGKILDQWAYPNIIFAGGEPTMMENLPEILALAKEKGKQPFIATNGLKLANWRYVSRLVDCGLAGASVSLNGVSHSSLRATDGQDVLDAKIRALANLVRLGLRFTVSMSMVRGVNEHELGKVFHLALKLYPFAKEFAVENCPGVGRSPDGRRIYLSELVKIFASSLGFAPHLLLEMVKDGRADLSAYAIRFSYGRLLGARVRHSGRGRDGRIQRLLTVWRDAGLRSAIRHSVHRSWTRNGMAVRLISSPNADNVDLEAVARSEEGRLLIVSRESPVMPLWEYCCRYQRSKP